MKSSQLGNKDETAKRVVSRLSSVLAIANFLVFPANAGDEKTCVVQPGDSVAKIARHAGVSQADLIEANDLGNPPVIRPGQELVIPGELKDGRRGHVVGERDTLARIAKRYKVSVKELAELNQIAEGELLTIGRTLLIPGAKSESKKIAGKREDERRLVAIVRVATGKSAKVFLTTKGGAVSQKGLTALSELAASRPVKNKSGKIVRKSKVKRLHPRLAKLLDAVAEQYPGRTILIISGYRPRKNRKDHSKHGEGRALDFRVEGLDNRELYEFIRTLPKAGTGFYPNSTFVHLDARDRSATWTDYSGPGERPRYASQEAAQDFEAAADAESASERVEEQETSAPQEPESPEPSQHDTQH